jgi:hypothetical protein
VVAQLRCARGAQGVAPRLLIISPLFGITLMVKETLSRLMP